MHELLAGCIVNDEENRVLLTRSPFGQDIARILGIDQVISVDDTPILEVPCAVLQPGDQPASVLSKLVRDKYQVDIAPSESIPIDIGAIGSAGGCKLVRSKLVGRGVQHDDDLRWLDLGLPGQYMTEVDLGPIAQKLRHLLQNGELEL